MKLVLAGMVSLAIGFFVTENSRAANWINSAGGLFSTPGNWSGGVPSGGQPAVFNLSSNYAVNVNGGHTHGQLFATAAGNANVTFDITGSGYAASTTSIGASTGSINNVSITGNLFTTGKADIAPNAGQASLTLSAPMHAPYVAVGGTIVPNMSDPFFDAQNAGGKGTLTLNPGADLTVQSLLADNAGADSAVIFNGGQLTIEGLGRFNTGDAHTFTRIGDGANTAVLNLEQGPVAFRPGIFEFGTDTLYISTNATVNYDAYNANLRVGNIHRDTSGGPAGIFNWQNGLITLRTGDLDISEAGAFGSNLVLSGNRGLELYHGTTRIASGGTLTLDGVSFSTNGLTNNGGTFNYLRGSISTGNGGIEVGPGGITNPGGISIDVDEVFNVFNGTLTIAAGHTVTVDGGTVYLGGVAGPGNLVFNRGYLQMESGDLTFGDANTELVGNSSIFLEDGTIIVGTAKNLNLNGGSLVAKNIGGGGQVAFNAGQLIITGDELTLGATGQINNSPSITVEAGSSIRADNGTITVQPGQILDVDGGYVAARTIVSNSSITVGGGGSIEGGSLYLGGIGGRGSLKTIVDGLIKLQRIGRNNLIVDGGVVEVTGEPAPPGEEDPIFDNSIVGGFDHDSEMTMNAGQVTTPNMKIGVTPGFTDVVTINGGRLQTDNLWAAGGAGSIFRFNGGTIETKHSEIDGPSTFVVGNGTIEAELILVDGTHSFADGLAISASGVVTGYGTMEGNVSNDGRLLPGDYDDGDGTVIEIDGNLDNTGVIEFGILDSELSMKLFVNGNFDSGGVIAVTLFGYEPSLGEAFDLMDFSSFTDSGFAFDFAKAVLPAGMIWDTSTFASNGTVRVADGLSGDFNDDGSVDAADYVLWRKLGGVESNYNLWRNHFGENIGAGGAIRGDVVPEPSNMTMLLVGSVFAIGGIIWRSGLRNTARESSHVSIQA